MTVDIWRLVADFYEAMGWDEKGCPLKKTLTALGIEPEACTS